MAVTAGALSLISKTSTQAVLNSAAATAGTGPYTYQWYRSTASGFTPGGGNIIDGATDLDLTDTGLIPGTQYYYKVIATDTGAGDATDTSAELAVATDNATQSQNAFAQSNQVGALDLRFNGNTVAVQIDATETAELVPGQAVKMYDSTGGVPKVVACSADDDEVLGFINYNQKDVSYGAGDACEISMKGNVMWLYATAAIARGAQVVVDLTTKGGVAPLSAGGSRIVGWAIDKAAIGTLIRVMIETPSFTLDS
jgi:hypothetical protein